MSSSEEDSSICGNTDNSAVTIPGAPNWGDMGKEERMGVVLRFLADHGLALPPRAIYRNLRFHQNITFSLGSVENYLEEYSRSGYVERVDPDALEERRVEQIASGESKKAYYIVTEAGRKHLRSED